MPLFLFGIDDKFDLTKINMKDKELYEVLQVPLEKNVTDISLEHYVELSKKIGSERVLRTLINISRRCKGLNEDHQGIKSLIKSLLEEVSVEKLVESCPMCDEEVLSIFECGNCGFSFLDTFHCSYLNERVMTCGKDDQRCHCLGLEWEGCWKIQK